MSRNFKMSVENFRVFKEMTEFDLRPITILVGPNNSGKSSFTKLLLLLKNGFDPLNFKNGEHHLGSYEKALNWDTESEEIVIKNEAAYFLSPHHFTEEIRFDKNGIVKRQTITNNNTGQNLLKFDLLKKQKFAPNQPVHFSLDIEYIINLLYDKEILVNCPFVDEALNYITTNLVPLKKLKKYSKDEELSLIKQKAVDYYLPNIFLKNFKKPSDPLKENLILNSILVNEIANLEKNYLLCDVFVNGRKLTDQNKILKYQWQIFENREIHLYIPSILDRPLKETMKSAFNALKNGLKRKIEKEYKELSAENGDGINVEVKATILGQLIFAENLFEGSLADPLDITSGNFSASLFQRFSSKIFTKLNQLKNIEYIPVNRGNQSRVLLADSNETTYKGVTDYHKFKNNTDKDNLSSMFQTINPEKLLKDILKEIGITGKITTKHLEDTVSVVYIEKNGRNINLADFGFGYSQLVPIILKIYNLTCQNEFNSILIIEEPEANLHPNLQAKLADIFALVIKHNQNWRIIVETHSEYLVRKLQYLVAKQEIEREDCIIHYFNTDENVSEEEPKVKPIEINEEGNLTDNFGPGFFDEATRLQFDLLKLNKNQSN